MVPPYPAWRLGLRIGSNRSTSLTWSIESLSLRVPLLPLSLVEQSRFEPVTSTGFQGHEALLQELLGSWADFNDVHRCSKEQVEILTM